MVDLPKEIIRGIVSSRCIEDFMRSREPDYENMFHPGQEILGHYYVAPFQRPAVWSEEQSAKLIESVYLGISIGGIVVSTEGKVEKDGKFSKEADWIIDGQQRMRAIKRYLDNDLVVFKGTPHEHKWEDLERPQKRRFLMTSVGFTRLDEADEESLRELYDRLNFGGTNHTEDQRAVKPK
jgi:hypothetical protein